jgi:hypothetical protein
MDPSFGDRTFVTDRRPIPPPACFDSGVRRISRPSSIAARQDGADEGCAGSARDADLPTPGFTMTRNSAMKIQDFRGLAEPNSHRGVA